MTPPSPTASFLFLVPRHHPSACTSPPHHPPFSRNKVNFQGISALVNAASFSFTETHSIPTHSIPPLVCGRCDFCRLLSSIHSPCHGITSSDAPAFPSTSGKHRPTVLSTSGSVLSLYLLLSQSMDSTRIQFLVKQRHDHTHRGAAAHRPFGHLLPQPPCVLNPEATSRLLRRVRIHHLANPTRLGIVGGDGRVLHFTFSFLCTSDPCICDPSGCL